MVFQLWPWEIPHHFGWNYLIPIYLVLGGIAGGAYVAAAVADFLSDKKPGYRDISIAGAIISPIAIGVGTALLFLDLGNPVRAMIVPLAFRNPTSWLAIGAWMLSVLGGLGALYAYSWATQLVDGLPLSDKLGDKKLRRIVALIGAPIGVATGAYTGLLLSALQFIPLWHTNLIPLLFTISALSTGIAAACAGALLIPGISKVTEEKMHGVHMFGMGDSALIVLELIVLFSLISAVRGVSEIGAMSIDLVTKTYGTYFWGGLVVLGLIVPVLISFVSTIAKTSSRAIFLLEFFLVLLGGTILRFVIFYGAIKQPPIFP